MTDGDDDSKAAETGAPSPANAVTALVAAGNHREAARMAAAHGDLPRAILLYERVWQFADALPLALRLGDRPLAIRLALDAGDAAAASHIAEQIPRDASTELAAAATSFAARGCHWEAARMAERAGDTRRAGEYFRRAGSLLDLGRMEELSGRPREAGIAYEQALGAAGDADSTTTAQLALGRLLARLGRHQEAARALQQAMRGPSAPVRLGAGRALTSQLLALGLRVAAAEIARRLRREWPALPESPEDIAALDAAEVAAGSSTVGQVDGTPGLVRQRFKVLRSLGAGATSHVYLAEDTLIGHPVALKLLSVGTGARGPERQAYLRFTREAEAAGRLRHPNIVALHDADPAMGLFVLELMSAGTLADRLLERKILAPAAVRRLALDLLSALGAAHEAGMVHRDVKPANILFDASGNAKLGDFGAAHLIDFGQTQTGGLLGTVAYMSPEQISGGAIGPTADLYALAVTLFEALTGRLPFPGPDIVAQHLADEPPRPSTLAMVNAAARAHESGDVAAAGAAGHPNETRGAGARMSRLTEAHDSVLLRALRKAPSERWRSAAQMAAAIRAWPADEPDAVVTVSSLGISEKSRPVSATTGTGQQDPDAIREAAGQSKRDVALGRSAAGRLFRRDDTGLGRPVLIEVRDRPVVDEALVHLRRLAAIGGPHVQRVLALSDDATTVTYEVCEGPRRSPAALAPQDAAVIAQAIAAWEAAAPTSPSAGPREVVMTTGGPVLLIVEAEAADHGTSHGDNGGGDGGGSGGGELEEELRPPSLVT